MASEGSSTAVAAETSSSTSTMDSTEKQELMQKANELLAQAKRNMVCGEVPKAISLYDEAVQMLAKEYGDLSHKCADAYFSYGSALLELGRMETNVLGVALEGDKEDEETAEETAEDAAEDTAEDTAEEEQEVEEEETKDTEESQDDGEEKDEDVPNFQLSWEYLELAKVIYMKNDNKEDQLKAAECHIKLGEVSMETEQHATAAEDLQSALKIQLTQLEANDRLIAQTHYQLGLAYGLDKNFQQSIEHYQKAIAVIEAKIASLNKLVEENEKDAENKENRETDELQKYKDEIKELQELVPEMKNKIEDAKTEASDMDKMKEMAKEMLGISGTSKGFGSPTKKADSAVSSTTEDVDENGEKKATDISSLVRKKRKQEDEITVSTIEVKKIKQDGDAPVVHRVNGTTGHETGTAEVSDSKQIEIKEVTANGDACEAEMKDVAEATASS